METSSAVKYWKLPMCKEWLEATSLKTDGKVNDIQEKIVDLRKDKTNPLKLMEYNSCTVGDIDSCVVSLVPMVSHIMGRFIVIIDKCYNMERKIKLFLNSVHHVDMRINMQSDR